MKTKIFGLVLGATLITLSTQAWAHHGTNASYDMSKTVTVKGTVTEFRWTNPHCAILLDVKDENGNVVNWAAETHPPAMLRAGGWSKDTLKPGDQVTLTLNPSKAGTPVGVVFAIVLPDGKKQSRGEMMGQGQGNGQ